MSDLGKASNYNYNMLDLKKTFDVSAIISAHYFSINPKLEPYWERYEFSQMFLILEGSGTYITESNERYDFGAGMVFHRRPNHTSTVEWTTERIRYGLISFRCDSEAMSIFGDRPFAVTEDESAALLEVIKTCVRVCEPIKEAEALMGMRIKESTPEVIFSFIRSSLERFLAMLFCRSQGIVLFTEEDQKVNRFIDRTKFVENVKLYLKEHISDRLTINDVCGHFGISQTALMKKFRREAGCSLINYFTDIKIAEAKKMIRTSAGTFTEISEALGFSSVNYFSKVFREKTGMSPTDYSKYASKRYAAVAPAEEQKQENQKKEE